MLRAQLRLDVCAQGFSAFIHDTNSKTLNIKSRVGSSRSRMSGASRRGFEDLVVYGLEFRVYVPGGGLVVF